MSRRVDQAPSGVEALLPSLSALVVNRTSTPKTAPIAVNEEKKARTGGYDGSNGPSKNEQRQGQLLIDPSTEKPIVWTNEDGKLDEDALKRVLYAKNAKWLEYYPPLAQKNPEEYGYKDWTSFFPEKKLQIVDPHWLRGTWPAINGRHDTLANARMAFVSVLLRQLKPLLPPTESAKNRDEKQKKWEKDTEDRETALSKLKEIFKDDGDKAAELDASRQAIEGMFGQTSVLGAGNRIKGDFPPPPGWLRMYKARTVRYLQNQLDSKIGTPSAGRPGGFADPCFVGPPYASWSEPIPNGSDKALYDAVLQDSPIAAWFVYLMYQRSSKTNDPSEAAKRKDASDEKKAVAEANASRRNDQIAANNKKRDDERTRNANGPGEEIEPATREAEEGGEEGRKKEDDDEALDEALTRSDEQTNNKTGDMTEADNDAMQAELEAELEALLNGQPPFED